MSVSKNAPTPKPEAPTPAAPTEAPPTAGEDRAGGGTAAPSAALPSRRALAAMDPQTRLAFENRKRLDREAAQVERRLARGEEIE